MAEFLAFRILEGKLEFSKVPFQLKEKVKTILIGLGHSKLAK